MMLCKADFEELFPETFKPSRREKATASPGASPAWIARWEDDGGRSRSLQQVGETLGARNDR